MEHQSAQRPQLVVSIGSVRCGAGQPLLLIAGPCVIQSRDLTLSIAQELVDICGRQHIPLVFKASFDKANRTSRSGYRGWEWKKVFAYWKKLAELLMCPR